MKIIRRNTFETNSSSTHSITLCDSDIFGKIGDGTYFFNLDDWEITDKDTIKKNLESHNISDTDFDILFEAFLQYYDALYDGKTYKIDPLDWGNYPEDLINDYDYEEEDFSKYFALKEDLKNKFSLLTPNSNLTIFIDQHEYLEYYEDVHITKNGDSVTAFGLYGYE